MNRYEQQGDPTRVWEEQSPTAKPFVGGWLLYFCIAMSIFTPIASIKAVLPAHDPLLIAVYSALGISSFAAGILTWSRSSAAIMALWVLFAVRLLYSSFQTYVVVRSVVHHAYRLTPFGKLEMFYDALNLAIGLAMFLYFRISRRVRETLGRNL